MDTNTKKKAKASVEKREKPSIEPGMNGHSEGNSKFARALGSVDYHTREKGLAALTRWLTRREQVAEADMRKIWKGLFYCFWHSDKAPVQLDLATRLAAIMPQLDDETAWSYFTVFITTMRREWFGIDRLRLDKFLMLIRKFVAELLACMKAHKWESAYVTRYTTFFQQHILLPSDNLSALGLAYHLSDLLLPELRSLAGEKRLPEKALLPLLEPFTATMQAADPPLCLRVRESVFEPLVDATRGPESEENRYLGNLDAAQLANILFEAGGVDGLGSKQRQALYDISAALEKAQRKRMRREEEVAEAEAAEQPAPPAAAAASQPQTMDAAPGTSGKKKRALAAAQAQAEAAPAAAAATPADAKSSKKRAKLEAAAAVTTADATGPSPSSSSGDGSAKHGKAAGSGTPKLLAQVQAPSSGLKSALRASIKAFALSPNAETPSQVAAGSAGTGGPSRQTQAQASVSASLPPAGPGKRPRAELGGGKAAMQAQPLAGHSTQAQGSGSAARKVQTAVKAAKQASAGDGPSTTGKPRVRIELKNNLYFDFGGPVPDPLLRTPPSARSKGGILKRGERSKSASGGAGAAVGSGTGEAAASVQQGLARVAPKSVQRAKAELFF